MPNFKNRLFFCQQLSIVFPCFILPNKKTMAENKPKIVIIGAGMAGITAAYKLTTSPSTNHFDISVLEASNRVGGRICSSEFSNHRVEMGATWIHGIEGSPVYEIANSIGAIVPEDGDETPWELMDGFPTEFVPVGEDGKEIDPSVFARVSELYETLKARAKSYAGPTCYGDSVGSYLRSGLQAHVADKSQTERELEAAVFSIYQNIERTYTSADDLDRLDASTETVYKEFPGEHVTIAKGYSRVVESLAGRLPAGSIRFGRKVSRIEWSPFAGSDRVRVHTEEDGEVIDADHVIVTVSLGVLKNGGVAFSPSLPSDKAAAIGRLGFGVMDKVFLEVENPFPRLLLVFDQKVVGPGSKIPWWMRRTAGVLPVYAGARVLHVWLAGKEAREMEALDEGDVIGGVQATIDAFCPEDARRNRNRNRIVGMKRSQWARDPLFLGSYSYLAVGSTAEDFDLMAEPLPGKYGESEEARPLQILFAGEATNRPYYSTTHGAYLSGVREAERLIQFYAGN